MISRVQIHWPEAQLVHRLDRDTSGLILVALTAELHRELSRLFAERRVIKRYVADVHGVPRESQGLIELPIAKRQHRPPLYGVDPAGKACGTRWRLLQTSGQFSRLELEPLTGRSHQLRVHLEAIGHQSRRSVVWPSRFAWHGRAIASACGCVELEASRQRPAPGLEAVTPFMLPSL